MKYRHYFIVPGSVSGNPTRFPMSPTSVSNADRERARLEALRRYAILDTAAEKEFDELAQRAARECGYPTALITMMDEHRCWFKAVTGLKPVAAHIRELPREQTFCNHAFRSSGIFVVPDARADERFAGLPIVNRPGGYRAYAGAQLITPDGFSIGTLCILDDVPHEPTAEQLAALRRLADRTMELLEAGRRRDNAPAPPVIVSARATDSRRTVLVVDDEELVRRFVLHLLNRREVAGIGAENGVEALAQFREHAGEIGLVITDIHMPEMNGLDLIRALKREPNPPAFAVMSGRLDETLRAALAVEGVRCVMAKPFPLGEIDALVALLPAH